MPAWLPIATAIAMTALVSRFYDLRRLDDAFVTAFLYMTALWVVGAGLGARFPTFPQLSPSTSAMLLAGYAALSLGGIGHAMITRRGAPAAAAGYDQLRPTRIGGVAPFGVVLAVGYALAMLFVVLVGGIPVLAPDGEQARVDARAGLGYVVIGAITLVTYGTVGWVARAYRSGASRRHGVWALVAVSAITLAALGNRAPVAVLVIACTWVAITTNGKLPSFRAVFAGGVAVLVLIAVAGSLRGGDVGGGDLATRFQWQFYVNPSNLERLTMLIPERVPHLAGRGYLIDLAVLLPGHQPNFGQWLKDTIGMQFPGGGITVGLLGELYANFGTAIAIVGAALMGGLLARVRPSLRIHRPSDAAFAVLLALALGGTVQSGIASVVLYSVIPLLIVHGATRAWIAVRDGDGARPPNPQPASPTTVVATDEQPR